MQFYTLFTQNGTRKVQDTVAKEKQLDETINRLYGSLLKMCGIRETSTDGLPSTDDLRRVWASSKPNTGPKNPFACKDMGRFNYELFGACR